MFFCNDTATTESYALSRLDALPIYEWPYWALDGVSYHGYAVSILWDRDGSRYGRGRGLTVIVDRSEEHTSELQSRPYLVCRLLLVKKKKISSPKAKWQIGRAHA